MKRTNSALALTIALTGLTALGVVEPAQAATLDTVASADAVADIRRGASNYDDATVLKVDGRTGRTKQAFLKFAVPAERAGEDLDTVSLRLRPTDSSDRGVKVYRTGLGWSEDSLSWANRPGERTLLGSSGALRANVTEVIALDADGVTPGQVLSLRVETSAQAVLTFVSSEGRDAVRPVVRVTTKATPPPVTPPTTTPPPVTPPTTTPPPVTSPTVPPTTPPTVPPTTPPTIPPAPEQPPATSWPPTGTVTHKIVGMSAPEHLWGTRISEVGANGVRARRIFADLSASGSGQLPLIRQAIADGMTPVISYKVPSASTLASGGYDAWLVTLRTQLNALGAPVTATFWHEPHGDMDPAVFRAASLRFFDVVNSPDIAVGPILNGWLLDRRVADFASYTDANLLSKWEFVGVDSYQEGTASAPSSTLLPARAVPKVASWLDTQGFPDKKIVLGEYNGFTGPAIAQAGEYLLGTPELWIGNVWNTDHTTFSVLTGDRRTAFQATKADARAVR